MTASEPVLTPDEELYETGRQAGYAEAVRAINTVLAADMYGYDVVQQALINNAPTSEGGYSPEQRKVCDYLQALTKGAVGCGTDPIGFLISSHAALVAKLKESEA